MSASVAKLESTLQAVLLATAPRVLPDLRLFRRNVIAVQVSDQHGDRAIRSGIAGQCDLYGIWRGGRHLEVELKAVGKKLSPYQESWQNWCIAWSIPHVTLRAEKGETTADTVMRWCRELEAVGERS